MPTAVLTSWLAPDWMARSAVSESRTPPAHDWMSVFTSWTKPRRSATRWLVEGRWGMAAITRPATSTAAAANSHRGVRRAGQPDRLSGSRSGEVVSVAGGIVTPSR